MRWETERETVGGAHRTDCSVAGAEEVGEGSAISGAVLFMA